MKKLKGIFYFVSGSVAVRRGDVIRCSVMFEEEQEIDGKIQVPVVFSVNRSRIVPEDNNPTYIEYSEDTQLFPCVVFEIKSTTENSVLAKVLIILAFCCFKHLS